MQKYNAKLAPLITLILLAMVTTACAQAADKEEVPELSPKGIISLEYPNQWDLNDLIALSNDGRYLIDASKSARYIRVWDWNKKEVVQRLLLNEDNPEHNDNKQHEWVLEYAHGGQNLVLTPDGRMVAACVNIVHKQSSQPDIYVRARIWSLENGTVAADILGTARNVPGLSQEAVLTISCDSVSYSPDGKYMAILSHGASLYTNEADFLEIQADLRERSAAIMANLKAGKRPPQFIKPAKEPTFISGIALYETQNWRMLRFIPVPTIKSKQRANSRLLFTGDGKHVLGAVFDIPPLNSRGRYEGEWVGSRIGRWNVESGELLEERSTPKLGLPDRGVWWHWLPGGREVWWPTYAETHSRQTQAEAQSCEAASAAPAFVSEVVENCAYNWAIGILDTETGKIKYLAPFKKNLPQGVKVERELGAFRASISPDGVYLVLTSNTSKPNTVPPIDPIANIDVLDRKTLRTEGHYSWKGGALSSPVYDISSKYFAIRAYRSSWLERPDNLAMVFELPEDNHKEGK